MQLNMSQLSSADADVDCPLCFFFCLMGITPVVPVVVVVVVTVLVGRRW